MLCMVGVFEIRVDVSHNREEFDVGVVSGVIESEVSREDVFDVGIEPDLDWSGSRIYISIESTNVPVSELVNVARDGVRGFGECVSGAGGVESVGEEDVWVSYIE